jgi:hypothetical protein
MRVTGPGDFVTVVIFRNKAPEWLWLGVQYISKKIPDEDRNLIKKGWDEIYRGPMGAEGFLSRAQEKRAGWVCMTHCTCFVSVCTVKYT